MSTAGDREIKALRVKCDNDVRGCYYWTGTVGILQDHMTKCNFTLVPCPNGCKNESILRKDLPAHLSDLCPEREYQCQDCGLKDKFRVITGCHDKKCEKKKVCCVNKRCGYFVEHGCVQEHVRLSCMYAEVSCKYASIICGEKRIRKEIKVHEEDDRLHLSLALSQITELTRRMFRLENQSSLSEGGLQVTFMVPDYLYKKINNSRHHSEPFYTSLTGYKMCLVVDANGYGERKGSHLSVFLRILHGPHDYQLVWPLKGSFVIELRNQLEDKNHRRMTLEFPYDKEYNKPGGACWGYDTFIKQSELDFNWSRNTQYLKDDKLYIGVMPKWHLVTSPDWTTAHK